MDKAIRIVSALNKHLFADAIPGHFATNHSHTNYYVDMSYLRHNAMMAKQAAIVISAYYLNTQIDTIISLEGTQYVAAYLAYELSKSGIASLNSGREIFIAEPASTVNGKYVFADNVLSMVKNKQILIMVGTSATGSTLSDAKECIEYYNGQVCGYTALFSNIQSLHGKPVTRLFSSCDLPHYHNYVTGQECPDCAAGKKLDALVTPHGYQKI